MNQEEYHEYLESAKWQRKRKAAIQQAGGRCQLCNSREGLQVHHRTYERVGNESSTDLTVLCQLCHQKFHGIESDPLQVVVADLARGYTGDEPRYAADDPKVLLCPRCRYDYLHQGRVEVYQRTEEDGASGIAAIIAGAVSDGVMDNNPSHRRDGVRIWFFCEECCQGDDGEWQEDLAMTIVQHKGRTYVGWETR